MLLLEEVTIPEIRPMSPLLYRLGLYHGEHDMPPTCDHPDYNDGYDQGCIESRRWWEMQGR